MVEEQTWASTIQPMCLPPIYIIERWSKVDWLIFLVEAQYSRSLNVNRVRILEQNVSKWWTVPLKDVGRVALYNLRFVEIDKWVEQSRKRFHHIYSKNESYKEEGKDILDKYFSLFSEDLSVNELALSSFEFFKELLDLKTKVLLSTDILAIRPEDPTEWLAELACAINCTDYVQGKVSLSRYFDRTVFDYLNINVWGQDFKLRNYGPPFNNKKRSQYENVTIFDPICLIGVEKTKELLNLNRHPSLDYELWSKDVS